MKFNFSDNPPWNFDYAHTRFHVAIESALYDFTERYTPYLGKAMTEITLEFSDEPIKNFAELVAGVSEELRRIKEDAEEGKSDNPLADVQGVCSFQFAAYCHCHAPNVTPKDLSPGR